MMKGCLQVSQNIPCDGGLLSLSPDSLYFAVVSGQQVVVYSCSTIQSITSFPVPSQISILKFSPNSKHLIWLSSSPSVLNICRILSNEVLEIPIQPGLDVISIIFGLNCLVYISELSIYLGVYDFNQHKSFTLKGCSLDDLDQPLLSFSPNGDYLVYVRDHQLVVYSTETWDLKALFNTPVVPAKPIFINPYTVFLHNRDGVIEWFSIFGTKIKSCSVLPSECIVDTALTKDCRTLFAATYDNKIVSFDNLSMERKFEFEYTYSFNRENGIRLFEATEEIGFLENISLQKFIPVAQSTKKEVKNILDQFKRKTFDHHLTALNHTDDLLATYNTDNFDTVWIWDFRLANRLTSVVSLQKTAGNVKALKWHKFSDRLAICCSNLVVIWSKWDVFGFPGQNVNFKWLQIKPAVGVFMSEENGRFVHIK